MARSFRLAFADGVSHVPARGNEHKAIVRDDTDRARCDAWVLMDTH